MRSKYDLAQRAVVMQAFQVGFSCVLERCIPVDPRV